MLSKQIEKAQRKVEEQNFLIRKRVLEYDDVMNEQRRIVYEYRDEVLEGRDMGEPARERDRAASIEPPGRGVHARRLRRGLGPRRPVRRARGHLPGRARRRRARPPSSLDRDELDRARSPRTRVELYDAREEELGEELMRALERFLLLQIIDQRWREHLYDMDYLREGIHLRGFAQIEPLVAYKNEAFELFARPDEHDLVGLRADDLPRRGRGRGRERRRRRSSAAAASRRRGSSTRAGQRHLLGRRRRRAAERARGGRRGGRRGRRRGLRPTPRTASRCRSSSSAASTSDEQIGRNDPCWCGSGKKFKKCHGA